MKTEQPVARKNTIRRVTTWISLMVAGALLFWLVQSIRDFYSFPQSERYPSQLNCPTAEIQSVISGYLVQSDHLEQANRLIIRNSRKSHKDGMPSSLGERLFDWNRAKYFADRTRIDAVAKHLCNGPTIAVNQKLVSGIPSIASELTQTNIANLEVNDLKLVTCAVVANPSGVRKHIISSNAYRLNFEVLKRDCQM